MRDEPKECLRGRLRHPLLTTLADTVEPLLTDTSIRRTPLYLRTVHFVRKRPNSIQTLPLQYGHLSITDSPHGPKETKFHTNSTSIIRTPLYYGQSTWSERDQIPYKLYLYNTDTSLLRTVHFVRKRPNSIQTLPL